MKLFLLFFAFVACTSCGNGVQYYAAADPLDAAREFIDGCLKGDFEKAGFYMLHNSQNDQLLMDAQANYRKRTKQEKKQLQDASLNIHNIDEVTETETIIQFSNSYDRTTRKVKVVLKDAKWQVDFAYTFNGNL